MLSTKFTNSFALLFTLNELNIDLSFPSISFLNSFSEIKDIHKIRSRGSENEIYVDMHIMINANTTTEQAHELSHNIEREIKNRINPNCQVRIHIEPYHKKENVL